MLIKYYQIKFFMWQWGALRNMVKKIKIIHVLRYILSIFKSLFVHILWRKWKAALATAVTLVAAMASILGFYYSFFITPDREYFSQLKGTLVLVRAYADITNNLCKKMSSLPEGPLKHELLSSFYFYHIERTRKLVECLGITDQRDRQGVEIHKQVKLFLKWNSEQVMYTTLTRSCPKKLYTSDELMQWESSLLSIFPSSFVGFTRFYYEKYIKGQN